MASFDDLLTKARTAPRPHKDVDVILDRSISQQTADLRDRIETLNIELVGIEADKRLSDPRPTEITDEIAKIDAEIEELTAGSLVTFRFTQLPGQEWAEYRSRALPRVGVGLDQMYGFNYHDAAKHAAASSGVRLLDDDQTEALTAEQWDGLWEVLSGHEFEKIASRIFELNEWDPEQQIARAGKASRAGSAAKSN